MSQNLLQLNQDKPDVMIIGELGVNTSQEARHHGETHIYISRHMYTMAQKTTFYNLKNISKVRPFLSQSNTERLMHAFIYYCNFLVLQRTQTFNYN